MKSPGCTLGICIFLFAVGLAAFAQAPSALPASDYGMSILGPPLIAWSDMQTPEPVPQPLPGKTALVPDPQGEQSRDPQPAPAAAAPPQPQPPALQTLTGTIVKEADKYVLQTSDKATFALDDPEKARPYEGKQVKVTGTLDLATHTFHIESIGPIS